MEKLVYVVWKSPETPVEDFKKTFLGKVSKQLVAQGAHKLAISLADEDVEYALASRITHMENPIAGIVSFWLNTALDREPLEKTIAENCERHAGYLVLESMPIVNTDHKAPLGQRTPGINTIGFLEKPDRLTYDEWREIWQGSHTYVAIETQSTFLYIQNVVVRALTEGAPAWTALVEEGFPHDALIDQKVFYDAGDSDEKLDVNRKRMIESCARFIDFDRLESHMFSQYVITD